MRTDYKFWYIKRDDAGLITEAAVRFYEGEYQTKVVENDLGELEEKQVYVRTKRLETLTDLQHLAKDGKLKGITEQTDKKAVFYNQEDFGQIKTDNELRAFLNKEIAKDKGREVINEQKLWQP